MKAILLVVLFLGIASAKIFKKCELASILKNAGVNNYRGYTIQDWVCMANWESHFDTSQVNHNSDRWRSTDYGIFQINSHWWCDDGKTTTSNTCNINCNKFLNDDITDDIECFKKVLKDKQGMDASRAWGKYCKGKDLSEWTRGCF